MGEKPEITNEKVLIEDRRWGRSDATFGQDLLANAAVGVGLFDYQLAAHKWLMDIDFETHSDFPLAVSYAEEGRLAHEKAELLFAVGDYGEIEARIVAYMSDATDRLTLAPYGALDMIKTMPVREERYFVLDGPHQRSKSKPRYLARQSPVNASRAYKGSRWAKNATRRHGNPRKHG